MRGLLMALQLLLLCCCRCVGFVAKGVADRCMPCWNLCPCLHCPAWGFAGQGSDVVLPCFHTALPPEDWSAQ